MPSLIDLIQSISSPIQLSDELAVREVTGLASDSRAVAPGSVFFALPGVKADGAQFIAAAAAAGAVAAVCGAEVKVDVPGLPLIRVADPRVALAQAAAAFYAPQPRHVVAVTGTDGKTSTADFFRQMAAMLGAKSASLGTLGVMDARGDLVGSTQHTTMDSITLHQTLQQLAAQQVTHVAMEASSHGLHQHRLDGVRLSAAAFTYLGRDHLDYHPTLEDYFRAKAWLFELLPAGETAVLNVDDARYATLRELCVARGCPVLSFGRGVSDLRLLRSTPTPEGQEVALQVLGSCYDLVVPLVGDFQIMNILAAAGLLMGCGFETKRVMPLLSSLRGVRGRLEPAAPGIYVDYAHTPMALEKLLLTLRQHTRGKLHVVFGCGGDRDPGKRPEMGRVAAKLADVVIVTDDNPRSENPALIRAAVMSGCPGGRDIAGRREAIAAAVSGMQPGDVLVVAGKGHETTQTIGSEVEPFDDVAVVREVVGAR